MPRGAGWALSVRCEHARARQQHTQAPPQPCLRQPMGTRTVAAGSMGSTSTHCHSARRVGEAWALRSARNAMYAKYCSVHACCMRDTISRTCTAGGAGGRRWLGLRCNRERMGVCRGRAGRPSKPRHANSMAKWMQDRCAQSMGADRGTRGRHYASPPACAAQPCVPCCPLRCAALPPQPGWEKARHVQPGQEQNQHEHRGVHCRTVRSVGLAGRPHLNHVPNLRTCKRCTQGRTPIAAMATRLVYRCIAWRKAAIYKEVG